MTTQPPGQGTPPVLRTEAGIPVQDNQNSQTAGPGGGVMIQDQHLIEKLARFNRERIPERVVHAVGTGVHGRFEVTNPDLPRITKLKMMDTPGKQTEVFARFSTVAGSLGAPDCVRDPRGFAVRFYTEDGNWDLVGNNTPVFFIRDAIKFPDFIHTQKPDPHTHKQEPDNVWDFFSLSPELTHQFTILHGDRGIPATLRNMHGFGSHTFSLTNDQDIRHWVKFHWTTDQGIKNLTQEESNKMAGEEPQHHMDDMYKAIGAGDFPSWTLNIQLMPEADAESYWINPFDVTKVWLHKDYPLIEVGRMTLDRVPDNFFFETEQAAFDPSHMPPGVGPSPDKMLQGRLLGYDDAQRSRLGINHTKLSINTPHGVPGGAANYGRDGEMAFDGNGGRSKNYEPNSFGGPAQTGVPLYKGLGSAGLTGAYPNNPRNCDDFDQAGRLYRIMDEPERQRLAEAIAGGLSQVSKDEIIAKSVAHFAAADPEYGARVAAAVRARR